MKITQQFQHCWKDQLDIFNLPTETLLSITLEAAAVTSSEEFASAASTKAEDSSPLSLLTVFVAMSYMKISFSAAGFSFDLKKHTF